MAAFNPNTPGTLGLEWFPERMARATLDSSGEALAAFFRSSAAETIDAIKLYVPAVWRQPVYVLDVYPDASAVQADSVVTTGIFRPVEDYLNVDNLAENAAAATTNLYASIDEAAYDSADHIRGIAFGTARAAFDYSYRVDFGTTIDDKRIRQVRLVFRGRTVGGGTGAFRPYLELDGERYYGATGQWDQSPAQKFVATFGVNPATGLPWRYDEVKKLDDADTDSGVGIKVITTTDLRLNQAWLEVDYFDETRVATAALEITDDGWQSFALATPAGVDNWAKADATDYLIVVHKVGGAGQAAFRYLDAGVLGPHGHKAYAVKIDGRNGRVSERGDELTRSASMILRTSAPADSADSQPYVTSRAEAVHTGRTVLQEFQGTANTYTSLRAAVRLQGPVAGADLLVKIKRRSDNVQLGGTVTFTAAELEHPATRFQVIQLPLASSATLAAVQYYLEFTCTAPDGEGWEVLAVDGDTDALSTGFGGTTDVATIAGVDDTGADIAATVHTQPATPASFTATAGALLNVARVLLTWTATALGGSFGSYEIDRSEDGGTTWQRIAEISTESVDELTDMDSPIGVEASYRIRVRRSDDGVSAWSSTVTATPTGSAWYLSSNSLPLLSLRLEVVTRASYVFSNDIEIFPLYDADDLLAVQGTEEQRDVVPLEVTFPNPADPGRAAFDALVALERAAVPYVCVRDPDGNRWFAALQLGRGAEGATRSAPSVEVTVYELTRTPYPVDAVLTA